ncbi:AaceriAFL154Cp [[Ashbya] aceris (nom. inval.)]|nr:AaceriAFL154Cp [[Ashbya] aceris (nom. inval.)]
MGPQLKLFIAVCGIYATFLTWSLAQEPLTTSVWPNSAARFSHSSFIVLCQALTAAVVGLFYLKAQRSDYGVREFMRRHWTDVAGISLTQALSAPAANHSLQYVDYVGYMLAKSCKLLPIMLVHVLVYRTPIGRDKALVGVLVSGGVALFTLGGGDRKQGEASLYGLGMLMVSLFLDGLTNASQDRLLRRPASKKITGAHLMVALNAAIVLWNLAYLVLLDRSQWQGSLQQLHADPAILTYLLTYCACGALGQCFVFFTLEHYSSLVLATVTVTRKMVSMLLSIVVYGHSVRLVQWLGILVVFGGITWETVKKGQRSSVQKPKQH